MHDLGLSDVTDYMDLPKAFDREGCPNPLTTVSLWNYACLQIIYKLMAVFLQSASFFIKLFLSPVLEMVLSNPISKQTK